MPANSTTPPKEDGLEKTTKRGLRRKPGDPVRGEMLARMVRVNQAGEFGAVRIYQGQLAVLGQRSCAPTLRKMAAQEQEHLKTFDRLLVERRVRPTLLRPLWDVAGFALGAGSALLGEKAAMACTVAVEEVIEEHYAGQAETLGSDEPELRQVIEKYREDEIEHRDVGLANGANEHPLYPVLVSSIKAGTRLAIWLSTRL